MSSNTLNFTKICSADETKLRKAEILFYSKGKLPTKVTGINLPTNSTVSFENRKLRLTGLSPNFYPLLITFWGKIYDDCDTSTKFRMISSLRNNTSNPTTFIFNSDNTMTMQIENINMDSSFGVVTCAKESTVEKIIAKIIIIYNPCE